MNKLQLLLISFFLLSINLLADPPKKIINAFTFYFDNEDTNIESKLDINGYFTEMYICKHRKDSSYTNIMFYPNGIVCTSMTVFDEQQKPYTKASWDMNLALERIASGENKSESEYFYGGQWGRYFIQGDTIKIQHIYKPSRGEIGGWIGWETWYKIIDRKTIKAIKILRLSTKKSEQDYHNFIQNRENDCIRHNAVFKPLKIKPQYNKVWLLKEKWFWCNENDWKEFMKNRKK